MPEAPNEPSSEPRYQELEHMLRQLATIAEGVAANTMARRKRLGHHRHMSWRQIAEVMTVDDRMAVGGHQWEPLLDKAEQLADQLGVPLALPRRRVSTLPPIVPQPEDVRRKRQAMFIAGDLEFGSALGLVGPEIKVALRDCATGTAQPRSAGQSPSPETELRALWTELQSCFDSLQKLRARNARTVTYLDVVGTWQRVTLKVRDLPLATQLGLIPPYNNGAPSIPSSMG